MATSLVPLSVYDLLRIGNYAFKHDFINDQNFPNAREVVISPNPRIFSFDRWLETDWVSRLMLKQNHRPATAYDLLHYAAKDPEREFTLAVIALGTTVMYVEPEFPASRASPHGIAVQDCSQRRGVNLVGIKGKWAPGCQFLGVPII